MNSTNDQDNKKKNAGTGTLVGIGYAILGFGLGSILTFIVSALLFCGWSCETLLPLIFIISIVVGILCGILSGFILGRRTYRKLEERQAPGFMHPSLFFALLSFIAGLCFFVGLPWLTMISPILLSAGIIAGLAGIWRDLTTKQIRWASPSLIGALLNAILLVAIVTTLNISTSSYGTCRKSAMQVKGYDVWQHVHTSTRPGFTEVEFFDGTNHLYCDAAGFGPLWGTIDSRETIASCYTIFPTKCAEGYFGVSP